MSKNKKINLHTLGNFTKNAVEEFEKNIISQHNYLESVNENLKNNKKQ